MLHQDIHFSVSSISDTKKVANVIFSLQQKLSCNAILVSGPLGSGKTTLLSYLMIHYGFAGNVGSPTFSLVHEYHCHNNIIYHMDLYRIDSVDKIYSLGLEEFLKSGILYVEWPKYINDILSFYIDVQIQQEGYERCIDIHVCESI